MNSAKITLSPINSIENEEDILDLLWNYFSCLYKNGQILKNYEMIKMDNSFIVFVTLPEDNALDEKYNNIYISKYLLQVKKLFTVSIDTIGKNLNCDKGCACKKSSWYMLYTDWTAIDSPLVCGDCGQSVPLYKIPHLFNEDEHHGILGWKEAYSEIDGLWLYCLSDRFTYRQLNKFDSQLSKIGRNICRELEKATGVPAYYYVFQYNKSKLLCPVCGADWKYRGEKTFIDYKCDQCRLVADEV